MDSSWECRQITKDKNKSGTCGYFKERSNQENINQV